MTAILCLNVGSASLKFSGWVREGRSLRRAFRGGQDAVRGTDHATIHAEDGARLEGLTTDEGGRAGEPEAWDGLVRALLPRAGDLLGEDIAVGHRVVHGGGRVEPVRIDAPLLDALDALAPLAPRHQPMNLAPARMLLREAPETSQIAVFDTAFHATMPELARRLPLPEDVLGSLRRHGFHGLSYRSVAERLAASGTPPRRVVAAHLSGGASACAMLNGRSVDTTMGATPLDGMLMGTRSGAVDPGVILYLMRRKGFDLDAMEHLLWHRSGLLGVSGISADTRDLLPSDDPEAGQAIALYCRSVAASIAALIPALGGLDALVFTGGAGKEQPVIRARVCEALAWLGIALDEAANTANADLVSAASSAVEVRTFETGEERMIAQDVEAWLEERADA